MQFLANSSHQVPMNEGVCCWPTALWCVRRTVPRCPLPLPDSPPDCPNSFSQFLRQHLNLWPLSYTRKHLQWNCQLIKTIEHALSRIQRLWVESVHHGALPNTIHWLAVFNMHGKKISLLKRNPWTCGNFPRARSLSQFAVTKQPVFFALCYPPEKYKFYHF